MAGPKEGTQTMTTAERNRAIKALLSKAFAGYGVSVKGSRGTSHGWVSINIGYAPRNSGEQRELKAQIMQLLTAAKIEIGTYGYDDPGSDYGYGKKISINFDRLRDDPTEDFNYVGSRHHY